MALGLLELNGEKCTTMYEDLIPKIFKRSCIQKMTSVMHRQRYDKVALQEVLESALEEKGV